MPWGNEIAQLRTQPMKLSKREARNVEGELRDANGHSQIVKLDQSYRIEARSGKKRSRSKSISFESVDV